MFKKHSTPLFRVRCLLCWDYGMDSIWLDC